MKKLTISYSLLVLLIFAACDKKEYPKDLIEDSDASFFSSLLINGNPIIMEAGKNGYYMHSSYAQDTNGVYGFIGDLNSSTSGIKIQFNDSKISSPNAESNINASLVAGNYSYYDGSYTASYGVEFEGTYNRNPKTPEWNFGDGITVKELNPIHYYKAPGKYNTCLTIGGTNACNSSICNDIEIGSNGFNGFVSSINQSDSTVQFNSNLMGGKAPFTYFWTFGDGGTSTLAHPKHSYYIIGSYPVKLRITDADSKTITLSYNAVTGADQSSCASNIKIRSFLPSEDNLGFSEVIINYTDENGINYSSKINPQSSSSEFKVLSVEDYEANEKGEKTKRIRLSFNCKLFSGTQSMTIESRESVFCVAYK